MQIQLIILFSVQFNCAVTIGPLHCLYSYLDPVELLFHGPQAALGLLVVTLQLSLQTLNPALQQGTDPAGGWGLGGVCTVLTVSRGRSVDQSGQGVWVSTSEYVLQLLDLKRGERLRHEVKEEERECGQV